MMASARIAMVENIKLEEFFLVVVFNFGELFLNTML